MKSNEDHERAISVADNGEVERFAAEQGISIEHARDVIRRAKGDRQRAVEFATGNRKS